MNYIDLFAGCGGLSLGLHNAGLRGIFAVEKNEDAFETLNVNLIENRDHFDWPQWLEKKNWDINELIEQHISNLNKLRGKVDLVVGGPPCQGFSLAGKRDSEDIRNRLSESYIEFVKIIKPRMIFFENVHGFTVAFKKNKKESSKPYSEVLINSLKELGYNVDCKVLDFSHFGVPQRRKRFILFATLNDNANRFFNDLNSNANSFFDKYDIKIPITIKQAIGDLERKNGVIESPDKKGFYNGKYSLEKSSYQTLMRKKLKENDFPDSHRFANHRLETIKLFDSLMKVSDSSFRITPKMELVKELKKRGITPLKEKTICPTITSIPDDFIHYSEPRIMTVREHARIQSFPDDFLFKGKYTTGGDRRKVEVPRYTQVANAVPPLFAEQVGLVIKEL